MYLGQYPAATGELSNVSPPHSKDLGNIEPLYGIYDPAGHEMQVVEKSFEYVPTRHDPLPSTGTASTHFAASKKIIQYIFIAHVLILYTILLNHHAE